MGSEADEYRYPATRGGAYADGAFNRTLITQNTWYTPNVNIRSTGSGILENMEISPGPFNGQLKVIERSHVVTISGSLVFSGDPSQTIEWGVFKSGAANPIQEGWTQRKLGVGGDVGAAGFDTIDTCNAGDYYEMKFRCISASNVDIAVVKASFVVSKTQSRN